MRNEKINLTILFGVALLLSLYLFFQTHVISSDGAFQYIPIAKDFVSGFYGKALGHNQQPLYSFLVALVYSGVGDFELAGKLVSSFFGIMLILPVYFLGKRIFDQKVALLSVFLLIIHPYIRRFSADVLKESTYLFFLATALWFAWRTIQSEKKYFYLFIPLLSVLTCLVRPDGIEVLIVVFLYTLFFKRFNTPGDRWKVIFLLVLSSLFFFFPYLYYLLKTVGKLTLHKTKSIEGLLSFGLIYGEVLPIRKILSLLLRLTFEIFSIFHSFYIFLMFIGLSKNIFSHFKDRIRFFSLLFFLHYIVLFSLLMNSAATQTFIFSGRHVLPLLLFSIYWIGEGVVVIWDWIFNKTENIHLFKSLKSKKRHAIVLGVLIVLILSILLPKTLKPQRYERLPEKWAGIWIKNHLGSGKTIFTTIPRVAYYADGNFERVDLSKIKMHQVIGLMREQEAIYLVLRELEALQNPEDAGMIKERFIELSRFEGKRVDSVILYKMIH